MKRVGFLTNHISYGGTEVALYDYAHCNETLLGNTSIVITRDMRDVNKEIYDKFCSRFPVFYIKTQQDIDRIAVEQRLDVVYVIKSGEKDWFTATICRCIIHCVFNTQHPHGDVYCAISPALNTIHRTNVPVLPHMISVDDNSESFRTELTISPNITVIGRYGSYDSFDIPFVYSAIVNILNARPDTIFLAMNTRPFAIHPRIIYLPRTTDAFVKRKFINTCDVMLHARQRGETFGLSCGEFAVCGKPIVTYGASPERAHIDVLGSACTEYTSFEDLIQIFTTNVWRKDMRTNGFMNFTPTRIMETFSKLL